MEAISKHEIIGLYWFEDEYERDQTVNMERYVSVLRKSWSSSDKAESLIVISSCSSRTGRSSHIKSHPWLAERAILEEADQQEVCHRVGTLFTRLNPLQIFICGGIWRTMCIKIILKQLWRIHQRWSKLDCGSTELHGLNICKIVRETEQPV